MFDNILDFDIDKINNTALITMYIGFATWVFAFGQVYFLNIFSERQSRKIKAIYIMACLEKDADFYDRNDVT